MKSLKSSVALKGRSVRASFTDPQERGLFKKSENKCANIIFEGATISMEDFNAHIEWMGQVVKGAVKEEYVECI